MIEGMLSGRLATCADGGIECNQISIRAHLSVTRVTGEHPSQPASVAPTVT